MYGLSKYAVDIIQQKILQQRKSKEEMMSRHPMYDTILFLELVQLMPHQSLLYNWLLGSAAKFCKHLLCRKAYRCVKVWHPAKHLLNDS